MRNTQENETIVTRGRNETRLNFVRRQKRALARKGARDTTAYRKLAAESRKLRKSLGISVY